MSLAVIGSVTVLFKVTVFVLESLDAMASVMLTEEIITVPFAASEAVADSDAVLFITITDELESLAVIGSVIKAVLGAIDEELLSVEVTGSDTVLLETTTLLLLSFAAIDSFAELLKITILLIASFDMIDSFTALVMPATIIVKAVLS